MIVRLKNVNISRGRNGQLYYYHRLTRTRIQAEYGTQAFIDEVNQLNRQCDEHKKSVAQGSLEALIRAYKQSPEFTRLADRTRKDYLSIMDWLHPIAPQTPLAILDTPFILQLRDKAFSQRKRRFANYLVQILSILLGFAKLRGLVEHNAAADVPKIRRGRDEKRRNRPWTAHEFMTFIENTSGGVRVAAALGGLGALREGDVISLGRSQYDGKSIELLISKTQVRLHLPVCGLLASIIDGELKKLESKKIIPTTLVSTIYGTPYTGAGFRASFFKQVRLLQAAGKVGDGLTFHGLRHTAATLLAEAGADKAMIRAITKHQDDGSVETYVRDASDKKLAGAAVIKLERAMKNGTKRG